MTKIYAFFIILLCTHSIAYAVGVGDVCAPSGSAPTEQQCDANLYCGEMGDGQTHVCQRCPNTHPNSTQGQNNTIASCYKDCGANPDFMNGTWLPDEDTVYYGSDCQYTNSDNISCNNSEDQCDGFHLEGTDANSRCVPNKTECESGFKIYNSATSDWGACLITECESGYHLENTANICGQPYGTCVPDTNSCASELTCDNGTITGTIRWQDNTYNYSDCKCNRTANLNYGTGTELCTWNGNTWSNCQITLETCIAGYWQGESENPTDCTQVSAGYYSAENELTRYACPAGSTSAAGSTDITACYMTGGTTQICDGDTPANCFTLPDNVGSIYYHSAQ